MPPGAPLEDIYLWFLPSPYRMLFVIAVLVAVPVLVIGTLLVWMFATKRRDEADDRRP